MNISNLQYSVRDLIKQEARLASQSQKKAEEAVHCWIVNLVREEGLEEKVALLSRRCMTRFLESLDQDSLPAWRSSQLLAAACLLVTTKIVTSNPPGGKKLLKYAGGAFSMEELMVSCVLTDDQYDTRGDKRVPVTRLHAAHSGSCLAFVSICF